MIGGAVGKAAFAAPCAENRTFAIVGAIGAVVVLISGVLTLAPPREDVDVSFPIKDVDKKTEAVMDNTDSFHVVLARYMDDRLRRIALAASRSAGGCWSRSRGSWLQRLASWLRSAYASRHGYTATQPVRRHRACRRRIVAVTRACAAGGECSIRGWC